MFFLIVCIDLGSIETKELYRISNEQETLGYVKNAQIIRDALSKRDSRWISQIIIDSCNEFLKISETSETQILLMSAIAREYTDLALQSTGNEEVP